MTTRLPPISPPGPSPMFQKDVKSLLDSLPFLINFDSDPPTSSVVQPAMPLGSQIQQKRIYLLGCVDGRTHTQYMKNLACDLMPWFYVSCNPTDSQLSSPAFPPQLHLCADLVVHWSNAFTDTQVFRTMVNEAVKRGIPVLTLKTPISKRLSDPNVTPDIIFDPADHTQSLRRLLAKLEVVLNVKIDAAVPGRTPTSPRHKQHPASARTLRSRRASSLKSRRSNKATALAVENIPRFLTDQCLHKTRSPDAESGYGSEKLISTLSASEPHLYHPTRYLIFERPQPDNSQNGPLLLHFPDELPASLAQQEIAVINSSDDEDMVPNGYFFKDD